MAGSPLLASTPAVPLVGVTTNPTTAQNPDTTPQVVGMGRHGQLHTANIHGDYFAAAVRGNTFWAYSTSAGIAVPINTTTSGSTFVLYNPPASGVHAEVIDFDWTQLAAGPATINQVGFSVVNTSVNAISSITKTPGPINAGGNPSRFNGNLPQCQHCSAATFASALTVAANWGLPLFSFASTYQPTATYNTGPFHYVFNGKLVVPPGWAITLTASTAWAANTAVPGMSWAEWPI